MTALPAPKVASLVRLLASDRDGEVLAAVRALRRLLAAARSDFNDLGDAIERALCPDNDDDLLAMARAVLASGVLLNPRQHDFVVNVRRLLKRGYDLTPKQREWLNALHQRARRAA